jgi:hypothetical protein
VARACTGGRWRCAQAFVPHDAEHPGGQRRGRAQCADLPVQDDQGFLGGVLRVLLGEADGAREAMHARARGVEQRADRFGVAALGRRDELVAGPGPPGAGSNLSAQ